MDGCMFVILSRKADLGNNTQDIIYIFIRYFHEI